MTMKLEYPYTTPTISVSLRNPELGDARRTPLQKVFRRSMDGTKYSYKSTNTVETLLVSVTAICDWTDLRAFIHAATDDDTRLTLFHGEAGAEVWKGRMLATPALLSQDGNNSHSITFEFKGIKQ